MQPAATHRGNPRAYQHWSEIVRFKIKRLQLLVAAVALCLAVIPAANRFKNWQEACIRAAWFHRESIRSHANTLTMYRTSIQSIQQIIDENETNLKEINLQGDMSSAADKALLVEAIEVRRRVVRDLQKILIRVEQEDAEHEDMARKFDRFRWMPWANPPVWSPRANGPD